MQLVVPVADICEGGSLFMQMLAEQCESNECKENCCVA